MSVFQTTELLVLSNNDYIFLISSILDQYSSVKIRAVIRAVLKLVGITFCAANRQALHVSVDYCLLTNGNFLTICHIVLMTFI
mmetsp:Transcript_6397/g.14063  ORF Transcript_6397/g.14063 Transcript_6397/m.14063 type:complete len:83 (+) Transcript_6397:160-408(+)